MMVDARTFRDGMARVVAAVSVVTTDGPAGRAGFTATAVTTVTDTPPTLLVCMNRSGSSHAAMHANGVFAVNVLAADQRALASAFAGSGTPEERFRAGAFAPLVTGAPASVEALVTFDCRLVDATDVGTHTVMFGEVLAIRHGAERPALLYGDRAYRVLAPPEAAKAAE